VVDRYNKREFKYGFRVPKTVKEAKEIDNGNRNIFRIGSVREKWAPWCVNVIAAVNVRHLIFTRKMEDF
jgi:hypothetical protein